MESPTAYLGRFAPSPSGPLHLGSLVAALGSWLDARHAGGRWLLRIEDLDTPRNARGADRMILHALQVHGLLWDGEVVWQSARIADYLAALDGLRARGLAYACGCSRREIALLGEGRYPGTCRAGLPPGRTARAWRMSCEDRTYGFRDRAHGEVRENVWLRNGDFILQRADGIIAYQLAVVVDDAAQGVSDVVRGVDLLDSTARQRLLQDALGLPRLRYLHLPLAYDGDGRKLSKQNHAPPLDLQRPVENLLLALTCLQQPVPPAEMRADWSRTPQTLLDWAIAHWRVPAPSAPPAALEPSAPARRSAPQDSTPTRLR